MSCYIFVCRTPGEAQETGASENVHTTNPGRTFKESQDQTPAPPPPLQVNVGKAIKGDACMNVNEASPSLPCSTSHFLMYSILLSHVL